MQTTPPNNQDLVSVVISAYNHERYVQDTIRSILDQTYPNIELIITNDGSPDRTHEKIEEMLPRCREKLTRVEYINKSNEGFVRSLNLCLSKVRGEYVYVIASDDVAKNNAIGVLRKFLCENQDYGLAVGNASLIDEAGRTCYWGHRKSIVYEQSKAKSLTQAEHLQRKHPNVNFHGDSFGSYASLLAGNYIPNGYLIRKSVLDKFGGYSEKAPLEDWHLMLQIAKHAKFKYIDKILFSYRWHSTNTIKQKKTMGRYADETLRLEIPYAKAHGYDKYLPVQKKLCLGSVKIFYYSSTVDKTLLRILGMTIYKRRRHARKRRRKEGE